MKRTLLLLAVLAAFLGLAAAAHAGVVELGDTGEPPPVSCPDNDCTAIGRVTGYQVLQEGGARNPYRVPRAGRVVAFTLRLGKPNRSQTEFFNQTFGSAPKARLSILKRERRGRHRLMAQSEVFNLSRYLGSAPTLALRRPLRVARGHIVALTVPTWAPAFSVNLGDGDAWRASRPSRQCGGDHLFERRAQERVRGVRTYGCLYRRARLRYAASFVPDPEPTS